MISRLVHGSAVGLAEALPLFGVLPANSVGDRPVAAFLAGGAAVHQKTMEISRDGEVGVQHAGGEVESEHLLEIRNAVLTPVRNKVGDLGWDICGPPPKLQISHFHLKSIKKLIRVLY